MPQSRTRSCCSQLLTRHNTQLPLRTRPKLETIILFGTLAVIVTASLMRLRRSRGRLLDALTVAEVHEALAAGENIDHPRDDGQT